MRALVGIALLAVVLSLSACGSRNAELAENIKSFLGAKSIRKIECKDAGINGSGEEMRSCEVEYTVETENIETTGTETGTAHETVEVGPSNKPVGSPAGTQVVTPDESPG